ncbi:helix-turn-helix domain-containing protein [Oryzibacter oryziterrae]|uniref:helix-turn-helix domain-containing protein n=1 Tax=Oryzibacter oryziterrae TaxID=2766474 RepID=UPI001F19E6B4|nr:helix-turn-helix transcriptional regulator [Oryzibacter oryziterrae]
MSKINDLSPAQCRMARAALNMTRDKLSETAQVSARTIGDFESEKRIPIPATRQALRHAFEVRGIDFSAGNSVGITTAFRGITLNPRDIGHGPAIDDENKSQECNS